MTRSVCFFAVYNIFGLGKEDGRKCSLIAEVYGTSVGSIERIQHVAEKNHWSEKWRQSGCGCISLCQVKRIGCQFSHQIDSVPMLENWCVVLTWEQVSIHCWRWRVPLGYEATSMTGYQAGSKSILIGNNATIGTWILPYSNLVRRQSDCDCGWLSRYER